MKKKSYLTLILGLILVAANLRLPIVMVPTLLKSIQSNIHISGSAAGMLTSIPLLTFAVMSPIMVKIGKKWGNEVTILVLLGLLIIGSFLRAIPTVAALFGGTFLIGIGITGGNVLLPAIIKKDMPTKIALGTSLYTMSMMLFGAVGTGIAGNLITKISLVKTMLVMSLFSIVGFIFWLPNLTFKKTNTSKKELEIPKYQSVWKQPLGWLVLLMFGLQSLISYSVMTWMPMILIDKGVNLTVANSTLIAFQLAGIPFSFIAPFMAENKNGLKWMLGINFLGYAGGIAVFLLPRLSNFSYLALGVLIGFAASIAFNLTIVFFALKTTNPFQTAELSGMAQSGGYLLAAIGPVGLGMVHELTNSWNVVICLLVGFAILLTIVELILSGNNKIKE